MEKRMNNKTPEAQAGRMHWVILVGAVVVVILVALTATVVIDTEEP